MVHGTRFIRSLRMRVGVLRGVAPEALDHAFVVLRTGTPAGEARLEVDYAPARFWCAVCGKEFETTSQFGDCPVCGTVSHDIRGGMELELVSMEVD